MTVTLDGLNLNETTKIQGEIMERLTVLHANISSPPKETDFISSGSFDFDARQLQNRDRSRSNYVFQMQNIAKNLDYSKVSISRDANSGAPMVFPRGVSVPAKQLGKKDKVTMSDGSGGSRKIPVRYAVVEANSLIASHDSKGMKVKEYAGKKGIMALNNGRVAGIKASYKGGNSEQYKDSMIKDAEAHGVSAKAINSIKKPVLVRLFDEASLEGIEDAGTASNEQVGASLSATEQGFSDAESIDLGDLASFEGGDITSAANRPFVRSFIASIGDNGTAGDMMDAEGLLSSSGARRIEAALVAKAFSDKAVLSDIAESADSELKSLGNAIKSVSGKWAVMRNAASEGLIALEVDITKNMVEALNIVRKSRQSKKSIYDLANQSDMLSGSVSETTKSLLKLFYQGETYNRIRAASKISDALNGYLEQALKTSPSADMFGFKPSPDDLLSQQQKTIDANSNQKGIFDSINTYLEASVMTLDGLDLTEKTDIQANIMKWFESLKLEAGLLEKTKLQGKIQKGLSLLNSAYKNTEKNDTVNSQSDNENVEAEKMSANKIGVNVEQQFLQALVNIGWKNQSQTKSNDLHWVTRTIAGGFKGGVVNPNGYRRVSARLNEGVMEAMHGDKALVSVPYDDFSSIVKNTKLFDEVVSIEDIDKPKSSTPEKEKFTSRIDSLMSESNIELLDSGLDKLAEDLESAGLMEKNEEKLIAIADRLNTLLANT